MALIPATVGTILFPACSRSGGHTAQPSDRSLLLGSRAAPYCLWLISNTVSMRLEGGNHGMQSSLGKVW